MVILSVVSNELPRIGTAAQSSEVQLGLELFKNRPTSGTGTCGTNTDYRRK